MTETALMETAWQSTNTARTANTLPGFEKAVAGWMPLTAIPCGGRVIHPPDSRLAEENLELLAYLEKKKIRPGQR